MATVAQMYAARQRRIARWNARVQWFGQRVMGNIRIGMLQRLKVSGQLLRDKVVINISIPVVKDAKGNVIERSLRGEFPRAETTRLMKDIFWEVSDDGQSGRVGTTLDYGLYLELLMDRSFLRRTLFEEAGRIGLILASPGGGPAGPLPGQVP